ncbi:MAG TPA: YtxH domain-containing protein [Candidatus Methylomirabilis sp.]|jgi:gas vesicle protein|nr:YtxH domain-containing protein [Candidatus Methylomirabilis sp.]
MSNDRGSGGAAVVLAFLLGGAFGALAALLYAPESGRRTRVRLRRLTEEFQDKALDVAEEVRDRMEEAVDQGREAVLSAYEAGKEAFQRERARITSSSS